MNVPDNLLYTKEHEWIKIEGNTGTIGITDHAQHSLGDITFADVPKVGKQVKQSEQLASVESVKAASDIYAPMSGKVVKVNDSVKNTPEVVNQSPYDNGWFAVIEISSMNEKAALMDAVKYREYLKEIE